MTRVVRSVNVGAGIRHSVTITDEPSTGAAVHLRRYEFLKRLVVDGVFVGLLNCGPVPFDTFRVFHDGSHWVAELEALELAKEKA